MIRMDDTIFKHLDHPNHYCSGSSELLLVLDLPYYYNCDNIYCYYCYTVK